MSETNKPYRYELSSVADTWDIYGPTNEVLQVFLYEYQAISLVNMLNDAYAAGVETEREESDWPDWMRVCGRWDNYAGE